MSGVGEWLILRADAGTVIGMGHVVRCLALAQAWQDRGGRAAIAMSRGTTEAAPSLEAAGVEVIQLSTPAAVLEDAMAVTQLARRRRARWLIVDGYDFDEAYRRHARAAGLRVMVIDDAGRPVCREADVILNQNAHARAGLYPDHGSAQFLLGPRYALLRRDFSKWQTWQRPIARTARRILVTFGGGDPHDVTGKVLEALGDLSGDPIEVIVALGATNPNADRVRAAAARLCGMVRIERNVTDMSALMAWADLAVASGGSTCWELAFMGLPSIVLVLSNNQEPIATGLGEAGIAVNLGWHSAVSAAVLSAAVNELAAGQAVREQISRRGRALVPCDGAARVSAILAGG